MQNTHIQAVPPATAGRPAPMQNNGPRGKRSAAERLLGNGRVHAHPTNFGHPSTMDAIFEQYGTYVERVLGRVMGAEPSLPDIVQDVYIAILSNIHSVRDGSQLKSWITSLTIFTARQRIRRRVRHRTAWVDKSEGFDEIPGKAFDPEEREALHLVRSILEEMSEEDRTAFTLRYIEGLEHQEAATVCGVSQATVKRRLARARTQFNSVIHQYPLLEKWIREGNRWHPPETVSVMT